MRETAALTQENTAARVARPSAIKQLLAYPRASPTVVGLTLGDTLAFYTFTTYAQKFLVNTSGFSKEQAMLISFGAGGSAAVSVAARRGFG